MNINRSIKILLTTACVAVLLFCSLGCSLSGSPIPMSPFESTDVQKRVGRKAKPQGLPVEPANTLRASKGAEEAAKTEPDTSRRTAALSTVSMFEVQWSLPSSANNVRKFKIEYGADPRALNYTLVVNRKELVAVQDPVTAINTFKKAISIPTELSELSVKITAIAETGEESSSAVFTSLRL